MKVMYAIAMSLILSLVNLPSLLAQSGNVKRNLTAVTKDIHRFTNNFHASIVVVTDEGNGTTLNPITFD